MSALVDDIADIGSEEEEDDDELDGEPAGSRSRQNGKPAMDDSSEEEDDDDDEEAAAAVREGFIVDEDEDEEERRRRRRERKKRRRAEREEEDEILDEEDLDLIGEANPHFERPETAQRKFKRLKQGHKDDRSLKEPRGVEDIFSDDDDEAAGDVDDAGPRRQHRGMVDDYGLDDFIEDDDMEDAERDQLEEDREVARPGRQTFVGLPEIQASGLDEAALEDMRAAFGDGTEYDWALELQEALEDEQKPGEDRPLELKDVFEPSQLIDKMLTDEDNEIRMTDVPERFQLARKAFKPVELTEEQIAERAHEETIWISKMLLPKMNLDRSLTEPFYNAVGKVLEFINVDDFEIPFIFQHRKDYLIHAPKARSSDDRPHADGSAKRLLDQGNMWEILDLDLKFKALLEKRDALQKTYDNLKGVANVDDSIIEEMLPQAVTMEEIQDIQDYMHFQYSASLKDINIMDSETNGVQKRARAARSIFEKIRASKVYSIVRAYGISADAFAKNALGTGDQHYTEDPSEWPNDLADSLLDPPEYSTGELVLRSGKMMYAEELFLSPRMRKFMRQNFYLNGVCDCVRTEKGARKITEDHPYYEFKYLRRQELSTFVRRPELYLRMLKAESEGLVQVSFRFEGFTTFKENLQKHILSDNLSAVADAWNTLRKETLDLALAKLQRYIAKGVKENMRTECEKELAKSCRLSYSRKLDQSYYKPNSASEYPPSVLALSNGNGVVGRDAVCWIYMDGEGRVVDNGKFTDLKMANPEKYIAAGKDVQNLIDLIKLRKPDVVVVGGFSVESFRLHKDIKETVAENRLMGPEYEDRNDEVQVDELHVIVTNDECARLYHTSERASSEHPSLPPLARYCVSLARYVQNPMKEYAALGKDIASINFDPNQDLLPRDKLMKALESAMVDMVNLTGVDINDAVNDKFTANLLPYVCGLGPRKAAQLLKIVNINGGVVQTRAELVGDKDQGLLPAVGGKVWFNCASFLYIEHDVSDPELEYLDNTRVHPEDYELARKMAADALELDEEDVKAETDENGVAAVVRKLIRDEAQEKVNELVLEEYAEQLETKFSQRKRATLETIRAELLVAYEELRNDFMTPSTEEMFTMFTGETKLTLDEQMVVPMVIRRVFQDHIDGKLDCGIDVSVSAQHYPDGVGGDRGIEARQAFQPHQTVRGRVLYLDRKRFTAQISLLEDSVRNSASASRKYAAELGPGEWDVLQEANDRRATQNEKDDGSGRTQRVIKHPLFHPFNAVQAEEFLGSHSRGDVVIRPSSKGVDHLAVTWKVSDNVYQHIDVLELDKATPFAVGKVLKIAGKYTYSDLDELIVNHVKAMAKKVDEIMLDERYQNTNKTGTEQWLTTYTEANPRRSMYAFCINPKYPGYFFLCFKAGQMAPLSNWSVKIIPNAFQLQHHAYPDMRSLKNGFKTLIQRGAGLPPRR